MKKQFITDADGNKVAVILPLGEYQKMLDKLDDPEDLSPQDFAEESKAEYASIHISLAPQYNAFIDQEIKSGRFDSEREVIQSALRLLESEGRKERELIEALEAGIQSGFIENFNPEEKLKELHCRYDEQQKISDQ